MAPAARRPDVPETTGQATSAGGAASSPSSVTTYLEADHRRLDAIAEEVRRLVAEGTFERAQDRFNEFSAGLNRHIDIEEQIVFPAFERATGNDRGPTRVMRHEHVEIRRCMVEAAAAIVGRDRAIFVAAAHALASVLSEHNMKEERVLYPMTDRSVGGERERAELVRRMQAHPG